MDKTVIVTEVTKKQPDQIDGPSRDGAFVHGLTLEVEILFHHASASRKESQRLGTSEQAMYGWWLIAIASTAGNSLIAHLSLICLEEDCAVTKGAELGRKALKLQDGRLSGYG